MVVLGLSNFYGTVVAVEKDGKHYLELECYEKTNEIEISQELYKMLESEFRDS